MTVESAAGDQLPRRRWRLRAECRDTLPEAWDTVERPGVNHAVPAWQVEMCLGCPVIADCAADALDQGDRYVIRASVALGQRGPTNRARLGHVLNAVGAQQL